MAENLFPELHHKMSKKIAQLTKVIYHLNTKNEDYTQDLASLSESYETEIDGVSSSGILVWRGHGGKGVLLCVLEF